MRRLTISAEVTAFIGAEQTAKLIKGPAPAEYRCVICHQFGLLGDGEDMVAGLDVYTPATYLRVWLAHAVCTPSIVRLVDGECIPPQNPVIAAKCLLTGGHGKPQRPVLVFEPTMVIFQPTPDGGEIDQRHAELLAHGMAPVGDVAAELAPHQPGWRVVMPQRSGARGGGAYGPQGIELISEMPPLPPGWAAAAIAAKWHCGLVAASRIGLTELCRQPDEQVTEALNTAAGQGQLIGITARVGKAAR